MKALDNKDTLHIALHAKCLGIPRAYHGEACHHQLQRAWHGGQFPQGGVQLLRHVARPTRGPAADLREFAWQKKQKLR